MVSTFGRVLVALGVAALSATAWADRYGALTYTPPPGWTMQVASDGRGYLRQDAEAGSITLYASRPVTAPAAEVFAEDWRRKVQAALPVEMPAPTVVTAGEVTRASGVAQTSAGGRPFTIVLVTYVVGGRATSVTGAASGDEAIRQLATFIDGMTIDGAAPAQAAAPGGIDVDFDVPAGYEKRREGAAIVLAPSTARAPCTYGFAPSRPSSGDLEADARAAFAEVWGGAGWQKKNRDETRNNAMRGTSAAGWPWYWYRGDLERLAGGSHEYASGMVTVFPAGKGRVNVLFGFGDLARCTQDDVHYSRLFHGLRPRGWSSDGGKALTRDLAGTWRNTEAQGMRQVRFDAAGRYQEGMGATTTLGVAETTTSRATDGKYALRGSRLTMTRGDGKSSTYLVRVYDEWFMGKWTRAMSLLDDTATPPYEVQYFRIEP
jgi:hypothetical protein